MSDNDKTPSEESPGIRELISGADRDWLICAAIITGLAAFLRFFWLELRPLHHDEGVNGHFLTILFREGTYHYDPANYHGPDLYYLSLAFSNLFGLNTLSVRSSVAIFGLLTVVLALYLKRYIGKRGSLAAAFFLAVSPGMVFISRYFIHEILFIFLSLSLVVSMLFFLDRRRAGPGAVFWITALMAAGFIPVAMMGIDSLRLGNPSVATGIKVLVIVIECFLIWIVVRMLREWKGGRPIYLLLAAASVALLLATKETAFITIGTMLIAVLCVFFWEKISDTKVFDQKGRFYFGVASVLAVVCALIASAVYSEHVKGFVTGLYGWFANEHGQSWLAFLIGLMAVLTIIAYAFFLRSRPGEDSISEPGFWNFGDDWTRNDWILSLVSALLVLSYLIVLLFTSLFKYPGDLPNFFAAYAFWAKTGSTDHTQNGYLAYLRWLLQVESPLIFLSVLGTLIAVIRARHKFAVFGALWALGLFLAYTIISYKTPWLALSFTLPMCIAAGYALDRLIASSDKALRILGAVLGIIAAVILCFQTYDLNFVRYDDEEMPYVYAHTRRGFEDLVRDIKRFADKSRKKEDSAIEVVSGEYWPMPWYFNDYPNARFHGGLIDANTSEIIVAHKNQRDELPERYSRHYKFIGEYPLRPGVELYLLVRNDLAGVEGSNIYEIARE